MKLTIAVTGASGFVGKALCAKLLARGYSVRAVVRERSSCLLSPTDCLQVVEVGEIGGLTDWTAALTGVDCVFHCAAHVPMMHKTGNDVLAAYRAVNVEGTRRLAEEAETLGVRRLVFMSSIKAIGEQTAHGLSFTAHSEPAPEDAYGKSKCETEEMLREFSLRFGLEVVIIRPPLVYGPGVKGNLRRLLVLVRSGLPLPFGAINNLRTLVGLGNLVDLLIRCADHPDASGQTFLVADGEELSTPELIRHMAAAMGKSVRILPVPVFLLRFVGCMIGRSEEIDRLVGSLQVDISHTCQVLDWSPPFSVDEGLQGMVNYAPDARV